MLGKNFRNLFHHYRSGKTVSHTGERLIIVGGAPRSGTTLFQHILDSHPSIYGGPEFDCLPNLIHMWRHILSVLDSGRIAAFCTREQINENFSGLIEGLLLPAADAHGAELLSEKTPFNVLVFSDLLKLFPKSRAIHVIRDPRAVVASMLAVGRRCQAKQAPAPDWVTDADKAAAFARQCLDAGFAAARAFPDRVYPVIYETLVREPEPTIRLVCKFLKVEFDPNMLRPYEKERPEMDAVLRNEDGTWLNPKRGFRPIETSRLAAWQTDLSREQVAIVQGHFHDYHDLAAFGYDF